MRTLPLIAAALVVTSSSIVFSQANAPTGPPAPTLPAEMGTQTGQRIRVTRVAGGLMHPWSITVADAKTMLVTEQPGRLRVIRDGLLLPAPAWVAPSPTAAPGAKPQTDLLHFVAVHPQFAQNGFVYVSHIKSGERGNTIAISRGRFDGTTLIDVKEIYTYGHRNGYGLTVHPQTGEVWQAEIGPLGGDEVNILLPGHNYGWPLVSTGRNYTGSLVSDEPWFRKGMDNPRMFWVPSISPSSLMFYNGDRFKGWKGSLFVGGLTNRTLIRVSFNQPSQAERRELLLSDFRQRIRDIVEGPDGNLYVATESATGGNAADGMILRIEPVN